MTERDDTNEPKKSSVARQEEETLAFWQREGIFEKSLEQTKGGEKFSFYDGPPFATGQPHYGHLLTSIMKDAVPRYQTMRGRYVRRVWGWDCHGLPVENLIEKELGLEHKKDILALGIGKFNEAARASVLRFDQDWKKIIPRIGRWIDMEESYKTMDAKYTESIWWAFKTLYEKDLVYKGYKSMHICPRCETTLSTTEVADGYKDVTDISVTVKFELVDDPGTFVLAWTTTPWTLPGNVALAVGEEIVYSKVKVKSEKLKEGEYVILAKDRVADVLKNTEYEVVEEFKGAGLVGKSYKPVFDYFQSEALENAERGWKIYAGDFVTTESGTGVVHIAPAFGEDDMNLGKKEKLPFVQHVSFDGRFTPEVKDFAGMYVKPKSDDEKERLSTDIAVLKYLQDTGAYFSKEKITHSYPHCWRCDTPLLNYATSSWFIKVTALKEKLLEVNKDINWIPETIKDGRFGKWLENARDWSISRTRFWGAPLPVWECDTCEKREVMGTFSGLKKKSTNKFILIRHGESMNNVQGINNWRLDSDTKYELTAKGVEQIKKIAEKLRNKKISTIYSSEIYRAKQSAELIAVELGKIPEDVVFDERIREHEVGDFEGEKYEKFHQYFKTFKDEFYSAPPGAETILALKKRMMDFIYEVDKKHAGETIAIVTHGYPLWMLVMGAKGATVEEILQTEKTVGSLGNGGYIELELEYFPHNAEYEFDVHRPYIDAVEFSCACGGIMKRIPEVFDCWVESGSMPFAQFHYTGDDDSPEGKLFRKNFPADFISEGLDQTRGWFYTMLVMGAGLFGAAPYKNAIVNGMVLAEDGRKMSKRLKNYPDIADVVNKYGADAVRLYMLSSPIVHGEDLSFSERGVDEVLKKVILRTENVFSFYALYRDDSIPASDTSTNVLDRWIIARLAETAKIMTDGFDSYELDRAARPVALFVDDLSTWYLRRSRDRFKSGAETAPSGDDARNAKATLRFVLGEFAKLIAPVMPFLAERVYAQAGGGKAKPHSSNAVARSREAGFRESVHLENWPTETKHDNTILEEMSEVRRIVSLGLEARAKAGIKVRQPLAKLKIKSEKGKMEPELVVLIADEVNVKEVAFDGSLETEVGLDTTITPALKQEGMFRDLARIVQDARKRAGMSPDDNISLTLDIPDEWSAVAQAHQGDLARITLAKKVEYSKLPDAEEVKVEDAIIRIAVEKA